MGSLTFSEFIEVIKSYNPDGVDIITKAYTYAKYLHKGQKRKSGEDFIVHPLSVAYIMAQFHAESDVICAALLHDTVEDTEVTLEQIAESFNPEVARLVDGVTKLKGVNMPKKDIHLANTRKIIDSITKDSRIIVIKLADRLHNMRTLEFMSLEKQKEIARETIDIYVPIAYALGACDIQKELEDLSFKFLLPDEFEEISCLRDSIEMSCNNHLLNILYKMRKLMERNNIECRIKMRVQSPYRIYASLKEGQDLREVQNLISVKLIVKKEDDCYRVLNLIKEAWPNLPHSFEDFIVHPKENQYQSLHTTIDDRNELIQVQIKTETMHVIDCLGILSYWLINKGNAGSIMQSDLETKFPFFKSLLKAQHDFKNDAEFVKRVKEHVFYFPSKI